jgi:hypothetical protein
MIVGGEFKRKYFTSSLHPALKGKGSFFEYLVFKSMSYDGWMMIIKLRIEWW